MISYYLDHPFVTLQIGSRNYMDLIRKHIDSSKYQVYESRLGDNGERLVFHTSSKEKLRIWMDLNQLKVHEAKIHRSDFGVPERMFVAHVLLREKAA
jgi:hypothetical protein